MAEKIYVGSVNAAGQKSENTSDAALNASSSVKFDTITDASNAGALTPGVIIDYGNTSSVISTANMNKDGEVDFTTDGVYTITGGEGAYVPYLDFKSAGVTVKFSDANVTAVKLRGEKGNFVIENSVVKGGVTVDNLTWVTYYNGNMSISNSVFGLRDDLRNDYGITVGNAGADDVETLLTGKYYGRLALSFSGTFSAVDSTIFAGYTFETKAEGGVMNLKNSVVYTCKGDIYTSNDKASAIILDGSIMVQDKWGNNEYYALTVGSGSTTGTAKLELKNGSKLYWGATESATGPYYPDDRYSRANTIVKSDGTIEVYSKSAIYFSKIENAGVITVDNASTIYATDIVFKDNGKIVISVIDALECGSSSSKIIDVDKAAAITDAELEKITVDKKGYVVDRDTDGDIIVKNVMTEVTTAETLAAALADEAEYIYISGKINVDSSLADAMAENADKLIFAEDALLLWPPTAEVPEEFAGNVQQAPTTIVELKSETVEIEGASVTTGTLDLSANGSGYVKAIDNVTN